MSQAHSISTHRRYGLSGVCDVWGVSRATVYRQRSAGSAANEARAPRRRGPQGDCSDTELLGHINTVIEASPFSGEGYRKVWARLRVRGIRTAARRVCRVMRANALLAPQRPVQRDAHPHDGTIVTDRVDKVWDEPLSAIGPRTMADDMTQTVTTAQGRIMSSSRSTIARANSSARMPHQARAGGRRWNRSAKASRGTSVVSGQVWPWA